MGVQHTALQYMVDMWKFSSQPVVSDALRLGRASIVPQSATAWSQQRRQQRVHGEFLESSVDIRVDRLACFTLGCLDCVASVKVMRQAVFSGAMQEVVAPQSCLSPAGFELSYLHC